MRPASLNVREPDAAASSRRAPATGGRPSREESARIAGRILDVAKVRFLRDGYVKTSMDAIAADLGMSKTTLYARFPGKSELFEAVVHHVLERPIADLETVQLGAGSPRDELEDLAGRLLAVALDPDLVALDRIVAAEARHFLDLARRVHGYFGERSIDVFTRVLARLGAAEGIADDDLRFDAQLFLEFTVLGPLWDAVMGLDDGCDETMRTAQLRRRIDIFLNGFGRQPKGDALRARSGTETNRTTERSDVR